MSRRKLGTRKNFGVYLIAFCLLIWLLAVATPVSADPAASPASMDTLEQMRQSIDQQRSQLKKERDRLSKIEQAVQSQLTGIQQNIQATDNAYQDYAALIELANKRLRGVQEELAIAEGRYYQKQAAIIARLRFLQRQRRTGFGWDICSKAKTSMNFWIAVVTSNCCIKRIGKS
jgi:septal ring factor EnvC (AmiA/AmiB activator)